MKIAYDDAHDLLNIEFLTNIPIDDSVEMDGVVIDYAKDKRIVAIEVLDASKRTTRKPLDRTNLAIVKSSGAGAGAHGLVKESEVTQRDIELAIRRKLNFELDPDRHTYKE